MNNFSKSFAGLTAITALMFSGFAYADVVKLGERELTEEQLPLVKAHCEALMLNDSTDEAAPADEKNAAQQDTQAVQSSIGELNIESITLEECKAAEFM